LPNDNQYFKRLITYLTALSSTEKSKKGAVADDGSAADAGASPLDTIIKKIETSFGAGTLMKLEGDVQKKVDVISTGSLSLDIALGIGGLPKGRVVEIFGPESSGKTTLALQVIASAQAAGGNCCFIDAEHALGTLRSLFFLLNFH